MSTAREVLVPDIGDFGEVDVIEVLVSPGDHVNVEDSLITLESDKATLEVPSPVAGKIVALKVKEGDVVSEGSLILTIEVEGAASGETKTEQPKDEAPEDAAAEQSAPTPASAPATSPCRTSTPSSMCPSRR